MASSARLHRRVSLALLFALVAAAGALPGAASAQTPAWTGGGPPGGNVYAVAADPSHAGTLYAGTQRGVFKSADGGASWVFSSSGLLPARVQALAVDPTNPSTIYAGTLTPNGVASVGIFKSTDSGATWRGSNLGLIDPFTGAGPVDIESVAVHPRDSNVVLAGGLFSEIYRSGDGGTTWQPVTFGGFSLGLQTTAIVFDPVTPANVYAASSSGFLRSADGGFTWSTFGDAGVSFFALAIDPTQPRTLYAGNANGSGIWKSTDGGSHWATANVSLPGAAGSRPPILALAVDPAHPSTVYAGTYGSGVWVSSNAGATWAAAANGMRDTRVASLTLAPAQSSTVYAGTYGGGVYKSVDGAQSWVKANNGVDAVLVSAVLVDPSAPGVVYAATSDGVSVSSDGGAGWRDSGSGLPSVAVATLALTGAGGGSPKLLAGTLGSGLYQSSDHGSTWTSAGSGLTDSYVSSLAVDPSSPATLYAGTAHPFTGSNSERVFKSTNGGATWTQTSLDAGQFSVDFIGINPGRVGQLLAGSFGVGGLFRSLDAGATWSTVSTSATCGGLSGIAFDASGSNIYMAGSTGVCRSADGGSTWSLASAGGLPVSSILVDPAKPATLYAGASADLATGAGGGVFVSVDGGQSFTALGTGIPPSGIDALAIDPATRFLYAGTRGAGVFYSGSVEACVSGPTTLCLNGGRFRVTTRWTTADGRSGAGQAVALTGDTGYFTFFNAANVEMLVKVVNGCGFNSRFWTFAGGLTDVNVVLTVIDSQTGSVKTYTNPQGTPFQPIQDTNAFACVLTGTLATRAERSEDPPLPAGEGRGEGGSLAAAACVPDATTLCLNNSRYKVQAQWSTRDGASGAGQVIPLTGDTGAFWFFSSNNVEMVVKVLNGCALNSSYWTFAGGLTNVNVRLTVTDTQTGAVKTYTNPQGTPFQPIQDTSAFATCP